MKTTVKCWFADKGYGFLNNGGEFSKDIMVHVSELKNCEFLKPGRTVEFDCDFNQKGLVAKNVQLVYEESQQPTSSAARNDNRPATQGYGHHNHSHTGHGKGYGQGYSSGQSYSYGQGYGQSYSQGQGYNQGQSYGQGKDQGYGKSYSQGQNTNNYR